MREQDCWDDGQRGASLVFGSCLEDLPAFALGHEQNRTEAHEHCRYYVRGFLAACAEKRAAVLAALPPGVKGPIDAEGKFLYRCHRHGG